MIRLVMLLLALALIACKKNENAHLEQNEPSVHEVYDAQKLVKKMVYFEELGLDYALSTKAVLGQNLMGAIQAKGTIAALEFCNIQAIPLTDSMSLQFNAKIKRVSDKNRNPNNKANSEELQYIQKFKEIIAANQEPKAVVLDKGKQIQFYYPITTNSMCLQCHGKKVEDKVRLQTLKLYPNDLAVGYEENEVRGIWSITFDKNLEK